MNVDHEEIEKFSNHAHRWWDTESEFRPLHKINPIRLDWIASHTDLNGKVIADIGCGGGILSESLAKRNGQVTGIDLSKKALQVAQLHAIDSNISVHYECVSAEALAEREPAKYDVVTCMEMLEHVPDPASVIRACATLVKPNGWVFFSTLNRTLKSFALAIVGAEYVLRMLPKGTHDYTKFLTPAELSKLARDAELDVVDIKGIDANPLLDRYMLSADVNVNYLMACQRRP